MHAAAPPSTCTPPQVEKRIAYLAVSLLITETAETLTLLTNSLQQVRGRVAAVAAGLVAADER